MFRSAPAVNRAASAGAPSAERGGGFYGKAHIGKVDGHVRYLREQFVVHAEGVSLFLCNSIGVFWLIQSQCQAGAASAARGEEHADA